MILLQQLSSEAEPVVCVGGELVEIGMVNMTVMCQSWSQKRRYRTQQIASHNSITTNTWYTHTVHVRIEAPASISFRKVLTWPLFEPAA